MDLLSIFRKYEVSAKRGVFNILDISNLHKDDNIVVNSGAINDGVTGQWSYGNSRESATKKGVNKMNQR